VKYRRGRGHGGTGKRSDLFGDQFFNSDDGVVDFSSFIDNYVIVAVVVLPPHFAVTGKLDKKFFFVGVIVATKILFAQLVPIFPERYKWLRFY